MTHWSAATPLWSWGLSLALATLSLWKLYDLVDAANAAKRAKAAKRAYKSGFTGLVGDTPLLELSSLSRATGCTILVRASALCRISP